MSEGPRFLARFQASQPSTDPVIYTETHKQDILPHQVLKILDKSHQKWTHRFGSERKRFLHLSEDLAQVIRDKSVVENPDFYHTVDLETQMRIFRLLALRVTVAVEKGNFDKLQKSKGSFDSQIRTMLTNWEKYRTFLDPANKKPLDNDGKTPEQVNQDNIRRFFLDGSDLPKTYKIMVFQSEGFSFLQPK